VKKIGWSISSKPDCAALSVIIAKTGNGIVSESTLYRMFFTFNKHVPYKSTLDIICKFLGYSDSVEFIQKLENSRQTLHFSGVSTVSKRKKSLIFSCIENTAKLPLYDFFEETNEHSHEFKTDVSVSIFDSLLISSNQNWFFKHFAHQKYVRDYFFERGHDAKFRIKNYDQAYLMYLNGIRPEADLLEFQDYIFGNCVLFRHFFLERKFVNALANGKNLYEKELPIDPSINEMYIFPLIRFKAYKLWYLRLMRSSSNEIEEYASFLIDLCQQLKDKLTHLEQKIVLNTVAECFINSSLPESYHWQLKKVFDQLYLSIPSLIYQKHLKYSLPYFNENGLLHFRP
jgi:hypothetical protein